MQYFVHVTSPVEERVKLDVGNPVVIGRDKRCTLRLRSGAFSDFQARVGIGSDNQVYVRDLDPSNHMVMIDGRMQAFEPQVLPVGAEFRLCNFVFRLEAEGVKSESAGNESSVTPSGIDDDAEKNRAPSKSPVARPAPVASSSTSSSLSSSSSDVVAVAVGAPTSSKKKRRSGLSTDGEPPKSKPRRLSTSVITRSRNPRDSTAVSVSHGRVISRQAQIFRSVSSFEHKGIRR